VLGGNRTRLALAAALLALGGAAASASASSGGTSLHSLEAGVLGDINQVRASHHLAPLRLSTSLGAAARAHSDQMGADGYFAHESYDGSAFWKRVQHYYGQGRYRYWSVGENLLWSSPDVDAAGALRMWMNSPEHRANLLNPRWREIGISAVHVTGAPGVYHGLDVTIVTTDFGVRK
jgi:uncharacterized protein YkwD